MGVRVGVRVHLCVSTGHVRALLFTRSTSSLIPVTGDYSGSDTAHVGLDIIPLLRCKAVILSHPFFSAQNRETKSSRLG